MFPKLPIPTVPDATKSRALYAPGDTIAAKYRLERFLGEGGMGAVWAAHNVALDSPVAIKLIRGETDREGLSMRLQLEARAAARLGHPAIVRVFDIGQTDKGDPFIVMELLEGESYAAKLDREGRLSAIEAVQLLLPIADALRATHAKGIVHRDIKPDNVFLAIEGDGVQPKLVDFGIAKLEQVPGSSSQLTQHGVLVGSPDYMSPEQARGEDVIDYRADVWAFSVVLYESITGRLPFDATNYNALLRAIVEEKPPTLSELAAGDAELSAILEVGIAKDRGERWRSMHEFGVALAGWLRHQGVLEDAVGASLDTKWINRKSDPTTRPSRPRISSIPDNLFSPASGVGVTVRAPAGSITPASSPATEPALPKVPTRRPYAAIVALGIILVAALATLLFRPREAPPARVDSVAAPSEPEVVNAAPVTPSTAPLATVVEARPTPSAVASGVSPPRPVAKHPAPPRKAKGLPSALPGNSDLIAPY